MAQGQKVVGSVPTRGNKIFNIFILPPEFNGKRRVECLNTRFEKLYIFLPYMYNNKFLHLYVFVKFHIAWKNRQTDNNVILYEFYFVRLNYEMESG